MKEIELLKLSDRVHVFGYLLFLKLLMVLSTALINLYQREQLDQQIYCNIAIVSYIFP